MEYKRISIDTSKHVFTIHGVDEAERPALRRDLRRSQVEAFFAKLEPTEVALEACAGAHHWGRRLGAMGHRVKLIPPQYVKPFVKRNKNDRNDAEAIGEAASRPSMPTVPVKSLDEQAATVIVKHRELLVGQRTAAINALRGHAAEFGVIAAKGTANVEALLAMLAETSEIPPAAKVAFAAMGAHIADLDTKLAAMEKQLLEQHKSNPVSQLLVKVPGIGPITAITLALSVNPANFESGRHFAAWLGLTPRENSTGGKHRMGRISKAGSKRLRSLLVVGATSVIRVAKPGRPSSSAWLLGLLARKPKKVAAVALANKIARVVWAMMARGEAYRRQPSAA
ncbi:IS110 family transposase [Acidiphilium sp.]|uniref:IS110 family transposase n=1 Tax=Acidiphilium sp. TaxID=527 RepID=UPI00258B3D50|nr:IS110 family transposase [Acidiphilium sp.]